jgi:hypothetical protein
MGACHVDLFVDIRNISIHALYMGCNALGHACELALDVYKLQSISCTHKYGMNAMGMYANFVLCGYTEHFNAETYMG